MHACLGGTRGEATSLHLEDKGGVASPVIVYILDLEAYRSGTGRSEPERSPVYRSNIEVASSIQYNADPARSAQIDAVAVSVRLDIDADWGWPGFYDALADPG